MVTGGCGFVGAHLSRMLVERGLDEVIVLDDCSLGTPENIGAAAAEVTLVTPDVRDAAAVTAALEQTRPDIVIHLAAIHFIPACDADPKRCIDVNVGGTQAVLDASARSGVKTVVLASTAAVYAPAEEAHREDGAIGPIDIYGLSKLWAEQLGELFHRRQGTPVAIARLFNVFGPRETNPHLIPAILAKAARSDDLALGNLSTRRDYVYTEDVAAGLIALAERAADHGLLRCNLGRETAIDGNELLDAVGLVLGRRLSAISDPSRIRSSDRPVLLSDCSRAHELLDWRAGTGLEQGLKVLARDPTATGVEVD
jgi:UDP-glucose 4-epimerase